MYLHYWAMGIRSTPSPVEGVGKGRQMKRGVSRLVQGLFTFSSCMCILYMCRYHLSPWLQPLVPNYGPYQRTVTNTQCFFYQPVATEAFVKLYSQPKFCVHVGKDKIMILS